MDIDWIRNPTRSGYGSFRILVGSGSGRVRILIGSRSGSNRILVGSNRVWILVGFGSGSVRIDFLLNNSLFLYISRKEIVTILNFLFKVLSFLQNLDIYGEGGADINSRYYPQTRKELDR